MRGMTVFGAALAALLLCSFAVVAPWAGGPSGEMHDGSIDEAAHLQEELRVGAAELAAVPAESRAVVAKVLGRLGGLRGELQELRQTGWTTRCVYRNGECLPPQEPTDKQRHGESRCLGNRS